VTENFHPFVFVAIAEVLVIWWLRPAALRGFSLGVVVRLVLAYVVCVMVTSVMGGLVSFLYYAVLHAEKTPGPFRVYAFGTHFLTTGLHVLTAGVFFRVLVFMVDRLFVVFGGYLISLGIGRVVKAHGRTEKHEGGVIDPSL